MTYEELIRSIRSRQFASIYFFHGEEPFFIDRLEQAIEENVLPEAERGFNQAILYGKDIEPLTLLDYVRRYPMMSERQVVVLREAQEMRNIAELLAYVENPMPTTVLVLSYKHKKYDMNTKFGKALKKHAEVFESKKLYDNQLPDWITSYAKLHKLAFDQPATALLAEYLGADLSRVANEIDKLAINLPPGSTITAQHVQDYVGISKDYNVYELQKALGMRDMAKVARIQAYFAANIRKNPLIVTIGSLYTYFSKVYMLHWLRGQSDAEMVKTLELRSDWFLKEYKLAANFYQAAQAAAVLHLLKEYDLRSKGINNIGAGEEELMKELFFKILHT